jgi:hypothetical protein
VNPRVRRVHQRALPLERLLQRRLRATGLAEHLVHAVAIHERPVRRPPRIEPQLVLRHDGGAEWVEVVVEFRFLSKLPRKFFAMRFKVCRQQEHTELLRNAVCNTLQSCGSKVNSVVDVFRGMSANVNKAVAQIHEHRAALLRNLPHCVRVSLHIVVALRQVRRVRRHGPLEWHRRDQHDLARARGELVQQPVIRRRELRQSRHAVERLHLPELRHHDGRARRFELPRPRAKVKVAPLLINRVRLPRHRTEARGLRREGRG